MSKNLSIDFSQISAQVSKIIKSEQFKSSRILTDFLKYVVRVTLEGNEQSLKEYVIAVEVLKKSPDFNPQLDAVVRIHARRLRLMLDNYYAGPGSGDGILISIPKGRYIPLFQKNSDGSSSKLLKSAANDLEIDSKPTIAVMPFECLQDVKRGRVICSVIYKDITVGLSHFEGIKVISSYSTAHARERFKNWDEIIAHLGVDYIITGSCISEGDRIRVSVELHQSPDNEVIWAETMIIEGFNQNELKGYESVVKKVVANTCGYFGIIFRSHFSHHIPGDFDTLYAIYWHNRYHQLFSLEAYEEASKAIEKGLGANPKNSMLLSFKAELLLNLCTMDLPDDASYSQQGYALVSQALAIDPKSQHAWQILAWAELLRSNKIEYERAAEKCLSINRLDPMYMGSIGFGHQCADRCEEGLGLMLESIDLNPYYHWVVNLGLCLYHIQKEEFDDAVYWANLINRAGYLWDPLLRLASMGLSGKQEDAAAARSKLLELSPEFPKRARTIVGRFLIFPELEDKILHGLHQAGIASPAPE